MNGKNRKRVNKKLELAKREAAKKIDIWGEKIFNIPNTITTIRVILTFVIAYMILDDYSVISVVIVFVIGMLTDTLDGNLARWLNQKTEFGRRYDQIADRLFFIVSVFLFVVHYSMNGILGKTELEQIAVIMSREIIGLPFAVIYYLKGGSLTPQANLPAKATTFLQAVSFPIVLLKWSVAWPIVALTGIVGVISGLTYIKDIRDLPKR